MAGCAKGVYRPRRPRETAFYRLVEEHFERFEQIYPERYEDRYGFFRPVIRETVYKYLGCGDLKQGFARVRCREWNGSLPQRRVFRDSSDELRLCSMSEPGRVLTSA